MLLFTTTIEVVKSNILMKTVITSQSEQVVKRIKELSLTPEAILEIIIAMVAAKRSWTHNDVAGAGGTRAYLDGTRRARDVGTALGWVKNTEGNLESMVQHEMNLRFVVCNANECAGVADLNASNRNPKGPATEQVVAANNEQFMFQGLLDQVDAENIVRFASQPQPDGLMTWYLFIYADDDTYRAELSCPASVEGGFLANCHERIILVRDGDNDNNLRPRRTAPPDSDDVFEITVTRKQA